MVLWSSGGVCCIDTNWIRYPVVIYVVAYQCSWIIAYASYPVVWCWDLEIGQVDGKEIMKEKSKKSVATRVVCAYTNCKHNRVDGMEYICTLSKIHISFHSSSDYDGWLMRCNMKDEGMEENQ